MRIAIMQPYFFPYIGYFSLMHAAEKFILLDTVQFQRKNWMTRNRIKNPNAPFTYIHLPTEKAPLAQIVQDITIQPVSGWQQQLFKQLQIYKNAPQYPQVMTLLNDLFKQPFKQLTNFHYHTLQQINNYLNLQCEVTIFSEMELPIKPVQEADEWALHICQAIGATEYVNPPGGINLFNEQKYIEAGVELLFLQNHLQPYDQQNKHFIPGLSIIDVLMYNTPHQALALIKNYTMYSKQEVYG